jgi:transketolase
MDKSRFALIASQLRYYILEITRHASSGHPTTSFSAVDLMAVLYFKYLRFDLTNPTSPYNDRIIFSKGHASALFYSLYAVAGKISEQELMTYRDFQSPLEGHPTFRFPFAEAATGSLGQGLSIGAGEAWALRGVHSLEFRVRSHESTNHEPITTNLPHVFVLLGDGELAEGSNWEAASWASHNKLSNLIAIADINKFGQSQETMYGHDMEVYRKRFEAFGWAAIVIDGHTFEQIDAAYKKALAYKAGPVIILAQTIKGKGVPYWEDKNGWHNKILPKEELDRALAQYKPEKAVVISIQKPTDISSPLSVHRKETVNSELSTVNYTEPTPTKKAFGNALERLGAQYPNLVVLDGDMNNSTCTDQFKEAFPDRFLQMYIAEQNMVGVAVGVARLGYIPVVSTFASFLTRAHDQIRMAPLSGVHLIINGSYVGVSMGKDGPSQMGLEDLSLFRAILGSTVVSPSDPYQTEYLMNELTRASGICYIRTIREPLVPIYTKEDTFPVGGIKVHKGKGDSVPVTVIGTGITVHEALAAKDILEKEGVSVQVIDCYSIKPLDAEILSKAVHGSMGLVVVEDHYHEGGLGEAVLSALHGTVSVPYTHLAVGKTPMSGKPDELLRFEGIDAENIALALRNLLH